MMPPGDEDVVSKEESLDSNMADNSEEQISSESPASIDSENALENSEEIISDVEESEEESEEESGEEAHA